MSSPASSAGEDENLQPLRQRTDEIAEAHAAAALQALGAQDGLDLGIGDVDVPR